MDFAVETGLNGPACFALSVRKCGSSIFNMICQAIAEDCALPVVNVGHEFFLADVREVDYRSDPSLISLMYPGNLYMSFRSMPTILQDNAIFQDGRKLVFIRDPRDALVSFYFSSAYSHPMPKNNEAETGEFSIALEKQRNQALEMALEDFVKKSARDMNRTMFAYAATLRDPRTTVLKYEDVILDKRRLISNISEAFNLAPKESAVEQILTWADVVPNKEDPTAFVRKVTPGDHREKLRAGTISELNEILRPSMDLFGYDA